MSNKLYVGNLAYSVKSEDLKNFFNIYGEVTDATVIMDRATNRSKGFGFVTFKDAEGLTAALENANGQDLSGRAVKVSKANEDNGPRRTGGGDRGGFRGNREGGDRGGFRGNREGGGFRGNRDHGSRDNAGFGG